MIEPPPDNGVFVFKNNSWIKIRNDFWYPKEDGIYVVFFMNTRCPACKRYWDSAISKFLENNASRLRDKLRIIYVKCDWFARECSDDTAKNTFLIYLVSASPTTIVIKVEKGEGVYAERYEGKLPYDKLVSVIQEFEERAKKHKEIKVE